MKRKNVLLALTLMYEEEAIATWDIPVQFTAQKFDARMNIVFFDHDSEGNPKQIKGVTTFERQ